MEYTRVANSSLFDTHVPGQVSPRQSVRRHCRAIIIIIRIRKRHKRILLFCVIRRRRRRRRRYAPARQTDRRDVIDPLIAPGWEGKGRSMETVRHGGERREACVRVYGNSIFFPVFFFFISRQKRFGTSRRIPARLQHVGDPTGDRSDRALRFIPCTLYLRARASYRPSRNGKFLFRSVVLARV